MKLSCPESQNRVSLKCGTIDSGSAMAGPMSGALARSSASAGGVPVFGIGVGAGASGCCAYAGIAHVAAAISDNTARSVLTVQRIDLQSRFPTCPTVNLSQSISMHLGGKGTLRLRSQSSAIPLPSFARFPGRMRTGLRGSGRCLAPKPTALIINVSISQVVNCS